MCSLLLLLNLAEQTPLEIRLGPALLAAFVLSAAALELRRGGIPSILPAKNTAPA